MVGRFVESLVMSWLFALALLVGTSPVFATAHMEEEQAAEEAVEEQEPDATIELKQWKVGLILGGGGGKGKLHYQGETHRLKIGGLHIGAVIGIARADVEGGVYNLEKLEDIEGTYTATEAAIAVTGGGKVWKLKNSKGVVLRLEGKQLGIELALDVGGVSVRLRDKDKEDDKEEA
ncbi:MAG: hypothetical protein QNJ82_17100 [Gammaproteobacteria bacterium]|nr:hypothetical protein [Gammaproteobacteria bacterium]